MKVSALKTLRSPRSLRSIVVGFLLFASERRPPENESEVLLCVLCALSALCVEEPLE